MGVSFKISKAGRRFCPKPLASKTTTTVEEEDEAVYENSKGNNNGQILSTNSAPPPSAHNKLEGNVTGVSAEENEVSFTLNLFPDGYYIGRPSENHSSYQAMVQDAPKFLHPYDRTSEALFSAIESGRLPGDMLDDIPCKYVDGKLLCEVRDYRNCSTEAGLAASSPTANKVRLSMSLENVVKDIPLMSDNTWTYGDLMEVESRILKALQPQLCLDPTPKLDRLCTNPVSIKLNLDVRSLRRKRRGEMPEVIVTSSNKINGKKVCIDRVPESSSFRADVGPVSGNLTPQHVHENAPNSIASSNLMLPRATSFVPDASVSSLSFVSQPSKYHMGPASNAPGASSGGQDMMLSYAANMNSSGGVSSGHGRRENQDGSLSPLPGYNKRARGTPLGLDGNQQQHMGTQMDSLHGSADSHWKNTLLHQQSLARGFQYANNGMHKFPQQMYEGGLNQEAGAAQYPAVAAQRQGMRYPKEEPVETERLDKSEPYQNRNSIHIVEAERNRLQQRLPPQQHAFMRSNFPQPSWNNFGQPIDNNLVQKRKSAQSPRVSGSGGLPQSPLSSKSGEFSSGSVGPQFGPVITSALGSSHKDKSVINSVAAVGGATSLTSSANDNSMQRQQQVQLAAKRRSPSLPKTSAMSGVGSPASVSNMSVPLLNASSPADDMLSQIDPMMLDRFSKIETVAQRHQITRRKNKVDDKPMRKSVMYPTQQLMEHLSGDPNSENFTDEMGTKELAKSLIGGSMNVCKFRVLTFVQNERVMQGNGFAIVPKARTRMILSAKPSVGTITMHYGDLDYTDFLTAEENLPILPNAHLADLLAAQLSSLMLREGYEVEDNIHLKPTPTNRAPQSNNAGMEMQPYSETIAGQQQQSYGSNEVVKPTNSGNPPLTLNQNAQSARMLPPQNPQSLQISQGFLPGVSGPLRPQQHEPPLSLQQQPAQLQRSPLVLPSNQLPQMSGLGQNSSMLLGNQMVNKPSPLQLQLLQQHQQQQQQPRKMMIGNNTGGLGGLGNVMGMGAPRGIGGQAISGPMGPILGGGGQNPMNLSHPSNIGNAISQQFHTGQITRSQAQAIMAVKLRMHQNRNMMGGGGPQSSLGGIAGARQMHPGSSGLSMLGHSLNRAMTPMQRSAMGPMAPPKLMTGMNLYMNQQIPQQQQQQPQPQMQLQQQIQQPSQFQQQQLQQQQDSASPLQSVLSPPQQLNQPSQHQQQQQQQASPQQMSQRTPMSPQQMSQRTPMSPQLSSGAMHCINVGNAEACPASPQLSSQTLGSVSSIANSPMELQGVNKNGSVSNG